MDDKIEELTGYSAETFSVKPSPWSSLVGDDAEPLDTDLLNSVSPQQTSLVREYLISSRHGKRKWLQIRGQAVFDGDGTIDHISGILFDITHQKRLEKQTTALNQLFFSFGTDHSANIHKVIAEASSLLSASCSFYLRFDGDGDVASVTLAHTDGRVEERTESMAEVGPLLSQIMQGSLDLPAVLQNLGQDAVHRTSDERRRTVRDWSGRFGSQACPAVPEGGTSQVGLPR